MNDVTNIKPHWSFWVIAGLALIWNVMGCANYVMQMNPDFVAGLPEAYQAGIVDRPAWATGAFAIAVFAAAVGCALLILRKSLSLYALGLSLLGTIGVLAYTFTAVWGTDGASILVSTTASLVIAVFLVWYANFAIKKGWIS